MSKSLKIRITDLNGTFLRRDGELAKVVAWVVTPGTYQVRADGSSYCVRPDGRAVSHTRKHDLVSRTNDIQEPTDER